MEKKGDAGHDGGDESRIAAALAYLLGIIIAMVIFIVKKEDGYVRFHSAQAIMVDIVAMVLGMGLAAMCMFITVGIGFVQMGLDPFPKAGFSPGLGIGMGFALIAPMTFGFCWILLKLYLAFQAFCLSKTWIPILGEHAKRIASGQGG